MMDDGTLRLNKDKSEVLFRLLSRKLISKTEFVGGGMNIIIYQQ